MTKKELKNKLVKEYDGNLWDATNIYNQILNSSIKLNKVINVEVTHNDYKETYNNNACTRVKLNMINNCSTELETIIPWRHEKLDRVEGGQ